MHRARRVFIVCFVGNHQFNPICERLFQDPMQKADAALEFHHIGSLFNQPPRQMAVAVRLVFRLLVSVYQDTPFPSA
jgi:hypothetical protein